MGQPPLPPPPPPTEIMICIIVLLQQAQRNTITWKSRTLKVSHPVMLLMIEEDGQKLINNLKYDC